MTRHFSTLIGAMALAQIAFAQRTDSTLYYFQHPPAAARPRVWWHWMNGNITKEGIRKDLLWMHRAGIGGFQNFDAAMETPQVVPHRLSYMTPEWKDAFKYAIDLGDSLKMEMAIAGSPGWSESGGSWVPVEDGMKKIAWTETRVHTGQTGIRLPQAPASQGTFQTMPPSDDIANLDRPLPPLYKDVAVIAFPLPASDLVLRDLHPVIRSSAGTFTLEQLTDGDLAKAVNLPGDAAAGQAWISYSFGQPQTIRSVTVMGGGDKGFLDRNGDLKEARSFQVSDDSVNFRHITWLPAGENLQGTYAVPATTGRYFRVAFKNLPGNPGTLIAELVLHTTTRVHHAEDKAGFQPAPGLLHFQTPNTGDGINPEQVIDLTAKMRPDGTLDWTAPAGNWCILRFGYTVMATTNHPATKEATGFEVDKMDKQAIRRYFDRYLGMYKDATGGKLGRDGALKYLVLDSWEPGAQNWTPLMPAEFEKRRGYSLSHWLPTLAGYVVGDGTATDAFLYDFRRTIGDMVTEYHYDQLTDILDSLGMQRYTESHELKRALIADGMDVKRRAAVPMSAMWTANPIINGNDQNVYISDIRESASTAHIYGQNLVAAESFSALAYPGCAWSYVPENLKLTADLELASGLNRFVIHESAHQPGDSLLPGLTLGPFGQWFNRHETWAEQARPWMDYLSRSSYLLQQGKFVADIAYYYGEDDNIVSLFKKTQPLIPAGYDFDYVNTDALLNQLSVKNGRLVTPSGMSYRVLVLDTHARVLPLPVLRKLQQLVKEGATIAGVPTERPAGLQDDPGTFSQVRQDIFGAGRPNVLTGIALSEVMHRLNVAPDFSYDRGAAGAELLYVHRHLADRDIYWVNNRSWKATRLTATFRITGKVPVLWHPETGAMEPLAYRIHDAATEVDLPLQPIDAVFVIFKDRATKQALALPVVTEKTLLTLEGPWAVRFQPDRGAPASVAFDRLTSFSENSDAGIKYFSGTATYIKTFELANLPKHGHASTWLDLGDVKDIAEVELNGQQLGTLWKAPFRIDIGGAVRSGRNNLVIKVTNRWANRLIGDVQPGAKKVAYTPDQYYSPGDPLLPAGLLGEVRVVGRGE